MIKILTKIDFDDEDCITNFEKDIPPCILGWVDIIDSQNNRLFNHDFNDDELFGLMANEDLYEWFLVFLKVIKDLKHNKKLHIFYCYTLHFSQAPYNGLIFSLNENNLIIKQILFYDDEKVRTEPQYELPTEFKVSINFEPINFQDWITQVDKVVDEVLNFLFKNNVSFKDNIYLKKMAEMI